jgi:hypothetical protein
MSSKNRKCQADAVKVYEEQQRRLEARFGFRTNPAEVFVQPAAGMMKLVRDGGTVMMARAAAIGFHDSESGVWRWEWEEPGLPPALTKALKPLR